MHTGWNVVILVIFSSLCRHSAGFWPFQVFAETDGPESAASVEGEGGAKRIAIIGMLHSIFTISNHCFRTPEYPMPFAIPVLLHYQTTWKSTVPVSFTLQLRLSSSLLRVLLLCFESFRNFPKLIFICKVHLRSAFRTLL